MEVPQFVHEQAGHEGGGISIQRKVRKVSTTLGSKPHKKMIVRRRNDLSE
jgi:hypothetical protein